MMKVYGLGNKTAKPPSEDSNNLRISRASIYTIKGPLPVYQIRDRDLRKIHRAANEGKVAKVQQILLLGEKALNETDKRKRTALHLACAKGHVEVVTLLVERKCQLNLCDDENRTALIKAVQSQEEECATILLKHGADPNLKDSDGNTALHYAVCEENISIVTKLLSHNADIEARNKDNFTPLLLAVNANQLEIVAFLVRKKANVHAVDNIKRTALMLAVNYDSTNMVRLLLENGVDVCCQDKYGWTACDYALIKGFAMNIRLIFEYKQKQISKNSSQNNPVNESSEDDSLSRLSKKPCPEDPWPTSEDSNSDGGVKKGETESKIGNGEEDVMPASELEKEDTESPWDSEIISESIPLICWGPLPEAKNENPEKMLNGHVADSAEESPHVKPIEPTTEMESSAADQALGRKDVQNSRSGVMPASELEKEDTQSPWDSESISESIPLICWGPLPEAIGDKAEKMLYGHLADSAEKSPHLKPTESTTEIKYSDADQALEWKDVQTLRSGWDSTSLIHNLSRDLKDVGKCTFVSQSMIKSHFACTQFGQMTLIDQEKSSTGAVFLLENYPLPDLCDLQMLENKENKEEIGLKMYPEEPETLDESKTKTSLSQVSEKGKTYKGTLLKIPKCTYDGAVEDDADGLIQQRKSGNTDNWPSLIKEKVDSDSSPIQMNKVKKYKRKKGTSKESAVTPVLEKADLPMGVPQVNDDGTWSQVGQDEGRPTKEIPEKNSKVQKLLNSKDDTDKSPQSSLSVLKDCTLPNSYHKDCTLLNEQLGMDCKDSVSLLKMKDTILSCERLKKLKTNHCERLIRKIKEMENEVSRLQQELSEAKEMKSQLEHQKVEWQQELCSLRFTLKDEQEKRRSTDGLYEKIRDELRRSKEQYKKQCEVKRELELSVRTLETELKTVKNHVNQVTNSHGKEEELLHKIHMLQDEIDMLKVEVNTLKNQNKDKENIYSEDIAMVKENNDDLQNTIKEKEKIRTKTVSQYCGKLSVLRTENAVLMEKNDDLQKTIRQNENILTETLSQYCGKLKVLRTENAMVTEENDDLQKTIRQIEKILTETVSQSGRPLNVLINENVMLTSKLENEKQNKERLETEIESYRCRLTAATCDHDQSQASKRNLELGLQRARDECFHSQDKVSFDLSTLRDNNMTLTEQPFNAESNFSTQETELQQAKDALREKMLILEPFKRNLSQTQGHVKEMCQYLQDKVNKLNGKLESLEKRSSQLESENMLLRQLLDDSYIKADIKQKMVIDMQGQLHDTVKKLQGESEKETLKLEERNKELMSEYNHLKGQMEKYENEKVEREAVVRRLQQELAEKKSMLKALQKELSMFYKTFEDETLGPLMRQIEVAEILHKATERSVEKLQERLQKLELENAELKLKITTQMRIIEHLRRNMTGASSYEDEKERSACSRK